ncbi:MAG: arylesterase [Terriglobia bacterium]|nr:MAG: arylesterase [Terriglobia bacterium]
MKNVWWIPLLALICACNRPESDTAPRSGGVVAAPAAPVASADNRPAIVCFGDSLTAGFGVDPGKSYPDILQQELNRRGYRYRVVNLGVSGDTTQDGLARLPLVVSEKPRIVVLEFGANDGLRGQPVSITESNLSQMVEGLQKAGARVLLAGITLPPNYGPEYIPKFNAIYKELAGHYQLPLIPFLLAGVAGDGKLMQADGLHPNEEGTRLVAAGVMRALEPLLQKQ